MIRVQRIGEVNRADINLPNEPFAIWGRITPTYDGRKWAYTICEQEQIREMTFPDESYHYEEMKAECFFAGAYTDGGACVGLAIYRRDCFQYLYLDDLKVRKEYRGRGIGRLLLDEGDRIAAENGYRGVYTIGQDNNLTACLFYLKNGFEIGGLNTRGYRGTAQEDKSDIYFYREINR